MVQSRKLILIASTAAFCSMTVPSTVLGAEGDADALFQLGMLGLIGKLGDEGRFQSIDRLEAAAEAKHDGACFVLAKLYAGGFLVQRSTIRAARLYKAAADRGHAKSQDALALLMLTGDGVAKDPKAAAKLLEAPAVAGPRPRRIQRGGVAACCLVGLVALRGCGPLVTVAASVLSGFGGGGAPTAPAGGAMGGAPSTTQNGTSRDRSIRDVLDHVDNQDIEDSCLEQLPPEASAPVTQCVVRPSCLPGMKQPIKMRICPAVEMASTEGGPQQASAVAPVRRSATTAWRWQDTP